MPTCPIPQCGSVYPSWGIMCAFHYAMVPQAIKDDLRHVGKYHRGKEAYRKACSKAIDAVLQRGQARRDEPVPRSTPYRDD